jgi:hypothetical protein
MTIQWLNDELTEAIVTRGWLWWKRQAHVRRGSGIPLTWRYASDRHVGGGLRHALERRRNRERGDTDWQPVRPLPKAKVVP